MTATHQTTQKFSVDALRQLGSFSSASLSPAGDLLVYVTTKVMWDENEYKEFIRLIDHETQTEIDCWEGSAPQWSPSSKEIAYFATHLGENATWIYNLEDKFHKPLAAVYESNYFMGHLALKNFAWSPDGAEIAYLSADAPLQETAHEIQVIERLLYKSKGGRGRALITDDRLTHVWIVPVHGGDPYQLTDSCFNEHSLCWSPDGNRLAFVSNRSENPDDNQLHDLWSIDLESGATRRHTNNFGTVAQPAWSPDGNSIAFLATVGKLATNDSPAEDTQLYVLSVADNNIRCLTTAFDRRTEQIRWHQNSEQIYFTAHNEGSVPLYRVSIKNNSVEKIAGDNCQIYEYTLNDDKVCYISTDTANPTSVFLLGNTTQKIITSTPGFKFQDAQTFWFESFDETTIQGWIIKPVQYQDREKYPLVLVIHGGPHNMFGYAFEDRMQLLAAEGFGVLFINPRGSSGYGQAFSNGTLSDWGGGDYKDLMSGVDHAIANNDWIDKDRLFVTGQSYGGYMTNRIITQTNRFRAAVADGGISNLISFAGTSLYHSLIGAEFNGSAYDNFQILWQCSPLRNVQDVKTPTLFLHGALDNEVPVSQAEEMYIALKKLGIETALVQYTQEGHGWRPDLKPKNRYDVLQRTIQWFQKYLTR